VVRLGDLIEPVCIARVPVRVIALCEIAKHSLYGFLTGSRTDLEDFVKIPILNFAHANSLDGIGLAIESPCAKLSAIY
jgi:hypothetical protein